MEERSPARFPFYGWLGALIIIGAEAGLIFRQPFISQWFTPIVWTGYILFADALSFRLRGRSLIRNEPRQALMLPWLSVGCWMPFELYNLRLGNWYYVGCRRTHGCGTWPTCGPSLPFSPPSLRRRMCWTDWAFSDGSGLRPDR